MSRYTWLLWLSFVTASLAEFVPMAVDTNSGATQPAKIAVDSANMGGDVTGVSTNSVVIALRGVPVADLGAGADKQGYGLVYDHATTQLLLYPVAALPPTNYVRLSGTASLTDVGGEQIGFYRILRPGGIPSMALNVGGYEVAHVDVLGLTLRAGSLFLLNSNLTVNVAGYDGALGEPAYTWAAEPSLGKYRFSHNASYSEGYCAGTNQIWFWGPDGMHLRAPLYLHGDAVTDDSWRMQYDPAASNVAVQVRVAGTWTNSATFSRPGGGP